MSILVKGTDFGPTEQVTSTKLDNLVDAASFTNTSEVAVNYTGSTGTCLQGGGLEVTSAGQLQVKDGDISTAKIADLNVTTAKIANSNVTKAKIENVANLKVLGNTSGSATAPQEVTINDTDTMSDASATTLATSESIKAYVDTYTLKYSGATGTFSSTTSYADLDLSSVVGARRAMVILEIVGTSSTANTNFFIRRKGSTAELFPSTNLAGWGTGGVTIGNTYGGMVITVTDTAGKIEHKTGSGSPTGINYTVVAYQPLG